MIKIIINKITCSQEGSSTLELALLFPVMLLMMVGAMDYGSAFARKLEIANAAKAGAQYALAVRPNEGDVSGISSTVNSNLGDTVNDTTAVSVAMTCKCDGVAHTCTNVCGANGEGWESAYVTVTISETYETPFFNYSWLASDFFISESTTIQLK